MTLNLLEEKQIQFKVIEYLKTPLTKQQLQKLSELLGKSPGDFVRPKEQEFKDSGVDIADSNAVLDLMVEFPKIIERPIVVNGSRAAIGRPPESVLNILD